MRALWSLQALRTAALCAGMATAAAAAEPGAPQAIPACEREARQPEAALGRIMAAVARHEHVQMGAARIDTRGGLVQSGFAEAERARLPGTALPAWRRVWGYWLTAGALPAELRQAGSEAEQRVALVDQPWSAVFIGYVLRMAGLEAAQFAYSAAHHHYVRAAYASSEAEVQGVPTRYAYRACDVRSVAPRVGDLLCYARGATTRAGSFAALREALAQGPLPMHCDLVVHASAERIDSVGGNVLHGVTLRQFAAHGDGSGRLDDAYFVSLEPEPAPEPGADPQPDADAERSQARLDDGGSDTDINTAPHLNRQPWAVLLQLRSTAAAPAVRQH